MVSWYPIAVFMTLVFSEAPQGICGTSGIRDPAKTFRKYDRRDLLKPILGDSEIDIRDENISHPCWNHTQLWISEAKNGTLWALRMVDAAGKPGSNIIGGETKFIGSYPECVETVALETDGKDPRELFRGRYCLVTLSKSEQQDDGFEIQQALVGVCIPSTCTDADTTSIITQFLQLKNESYSVSGTTCRIPQAFSTEAIVVSVIVAVFLLIMFLSTMYDVICIQRVKWREETLKSNGHQAPPITEDSEHTSLITENGTGHVKRLLSSFSVYTNTVNLLDVKEVPGSIQCINGVRFFSLTWIILYHSLIVPFVNMAKNAEYFNTHMSRTWSFQAVLNGPIAVDTFFTLSGLLVAYQSLTKLKKNDGKMNWVMFYCHRLWRLTPPYMLILLVLTAFDPYLSSGPVQPRFDTSCSHWWMNLLYINNFDTRECMGGTWYLACDMQFYILSPLIFLSLYHSRIAGACVATLCLLASFITTGVVTTKYDISLNPFNATYFLVYYIKPYCRVGPYIIGLGVGHLLSRNGFKLQINKWLNILLWLLATALGVPVVYALYWEMNEVYVPVGVRSLYHTVARTVWGICVAWVVLACRTGNGGFVNSLLSWKVFVPLSRLSYMGYLVHPIVIRIFVYNKKELIFLSYINIVEAFFATLIGSLLASFGTYLAFEAPMGQLEKAFLEWRRKPKQQQ